MAGKTKSDGHSLSDAEGSWLSINRAAKILEPGSGSFEIAKERIWTALRQTQLAVRSARPSPIHPILEYSEAHADAGWFSAGREREFVRGMQSSTECVQEWGAFLYDGGIVVKRQGVEALDGPRSWQKVAPELVSKCSQQRTTWNLPEALAWIATRDFEQVAQIGCDAPWKWNEGEEAFRGQRIFKEAKQRASIGWLLRSVSLHHCDCGAQNDAQREAWENCSCTTLAFNRLWDAVNEGKLAAFDEITRSAIVAGEIPGFALDCQSFTLSAPRHPGAVTFRRVDVERLWPQATKSGDEQRTEKARLPDAELDRWWLKQSNTEAVAVDDLWKRVQEAFPFHHISRERIRSLAGPRKRGPKPIGGKATAK